MVNKMYFYLILIYWVLILLMQFNKNVGINIPATINFFVVDELYNKYFIEIKNILRIIFFKKFICPTYLKIFSISISSRLVYVKISVSRGCSQEKSITRISFRAFETLFLHQENLQYISS